MPLSSKYTLSTCSVITDWIPKAFCLYCPHTFKLRVLEEHCRMKQTPLDSDCWAFVFYLALAEQPSAVWMFEDTWWHSALDRYSECRVPQQPHSPTPDLVITFPSNRDTACSISHTHKSASTLSEHLPTNRVSVILPRIVSCCSKTMDHLWPRKPRKLLGHPVGWNHTFSKGVWNSALE